MLKSCAYCGRIHERSHDCGRKPKRVKSATDIDRFRWTRAWQRKREQIKQRDIFLCQICLRGLHGVQYYTYDNLEVHHAIPLDTDFGKRLDDGNLITLCGHHHEMAERGEIPLDVVMSVIAEQNRRDE